MTSRSKGLISRNRLIGGLVFLLACAVAILWLGPRGLPSKQRHGLELRLGHRTLAERPGSRSQALDAITAGRFDQAYVFYRLIPETEWRAEDCARLGQVLEQQKRFVLAIGAFMAARRINPQHNASSQSLDALQTKFALATGSERSALHEAASRSELLHLIGNGPPLALFVLGMACYADNAEKEDEFLDRLNSRDHALLRSVKTTDGAIKLTARLLLETGRTHDAVEILEPLLRGLRGEGTSAGAAPTDCEAAWLLSRASLQLDQQEHADEMLALAGDFGKTEPALPEPAPFVGARRCSKCHPRIAREQQRESRHAQTLRFGSDLKAVPLPATPLPDPVISSITHEFTRKSDEEIVLQTRDADRVFRAIVQYAVGSGRHGITMLATDEAGISRELRVSYFGQDQSWGQTKGIDFAPRDAGDHIGIGLSRKTLNRCLSCHTTWFRSVARDSLHSGGPEGADHGIGCERCHGPGQNHVKAVESGFAQQAIALTAKTPSQLKLKSCVECHAADGSIASSDPEFTRAQGTTFLFSRCFTAGKDRIGCTTCHDPHRALDKVTAHYEVKCLSCHDSKPDRNVGRDTPTLGRVCPVNAKDRCISCHMPQVEEPLRKSRFTDHHIRVHRDL